MSEIARPMAVSDENFEQEVLKENCPVIVDFWAEWCGPCKMLAPIFDELAEEYDGKVKFAKLNIEESQRTTAKFAVRGIPTLILFKGGSAEATNVGGLSKSQLVAFIDSNI